MRLVADIGGTNARLALSHHGVIVPETVRSFANDNWPHFNDMLASYVTEYVAGHLTDMVIAVAGPVQGTSARLTNRNWTISKADLMQVADCGKVALLNDLSALGHAVAMLARGQLRQFHSGPEQQSDTTQSLVVGIGTGFNASPVINTLGTVRCLSVEAGHVSMPSTISRILGEALGQSSQFPTVETLFSGRGLTTFCRHILNDTALNGADVISAYGHRGSEEGTSAVDQYSALLGQLLRELTMTYMPSAGIYLAGSVARAIMDAAPVYCLAEYTKPCSMISDKAPSLFAITDDGAALHGCAAFD